MSEKLELRNFVGGEHVDTADGRRMDLVDPSTGEVFASAPVSGAEDVDRAYRAAAGAFETWRDTTPVGAAAGAAASCADAVEEHADELVALESRNTGKPIGLTACEEIPPMVDQIRFFAGAARTLEGKAAAEYMAGHTSLGPAGADRRRRAGDAVELPDDDGDLEDRPGARGRQHRRPQAQRHHPGDDAAAGRAGRRASCRPGVLNVVCGDRDTGRALVEHRIPAAGGDHRVGARRHGGRRRRGPGRQAGAPGARRQGAGRRLRRRRPRGGRRGDRRRRLLQRRPGLHRRHPRAGRPRDPRRLRRGAHRAGARTPPPRTRTAPATRTPWCRR